MLKTKLAIITNGKRTNKAYISNMLNELIEKPEGITFIIRILPS